jgi:hypothetical protein
LNPALGYAKSGAMPTDQTPAAPDTDEALTDGKRPLPPAAARALAEAAVRRAQVEQEKTPAPTEIAGRGGLDPARYGDWEINGLISDF